MTASAPRGGARLAEMQVIVSSETPVDAAIVTDEAGLKTLVLRSFQTFTNALESVVALLPGERPDDVRAVIRRHMPTAPDIEDLAAKTASPTWVANTPQVERKRRRPSLAVIVSWGLGATAIVAALVTYLILSHSPGERPSALLRAQTFRQLTTNLGDRCEVSTASVAECVNPVTGAYRQVRALPGEWTSTVHMPDRYEIEQGRDRATVALLPDDVDPARWSGLEGFRAIYDHVSIRGHAVVGSTSDKLASRLDAALAGPVK